MHSTCAYTFDKSSVFLQKFQKSLHILVFLDGALEYIASLAVELLTLYEFYLIFLTIQTHLTVRTLI